MYSDKIGVVKKIIHIVFLVYLILLVSGVCIFKHYCHENLVSFSIFAQSDDCCNGECPFCKNEVESYELQDDFVNSQIIFFQEVHQSVSLFLDYFILNSDTTNYIVSFKRFTPKPPLITSHLCGLAMIQVFRN